MYRLENTFQFFFRQKCKVQTVWHSLKHYGSPYLHCGPKLWIHMLDTSGPRSGGPWCVCVFGGWGYNVWAGCVKLQYHAHFASSLYTIWGAMCQAAMLCSLWLISLSLSVERTLELLISIGSCNTMISLPPLRCVKLQCCVHFPPGF